MADYEPITKRVNGIDLDSPNRGWSLLAEGTSARIARNVRRAPLVIGRRHGSAPTGRLPVYDEASVNLTWLLHGDDTAELEAAYRDLVSVLSHPNLTYEHVAAGTVTQAPAELVSLSEPTEFLAGQSMTVTAVLALTDPFLRDADYTTTSTLTAGNHTLSGLAGTAPIRDAVIRFTSTGSLTSVQVTDSTSGTSISWVGTAIANGRYLYLDPARMRAWDHNTNSDWDGTAGVDVSKGLDYAGAGPLQLWPATSVADGELQHDVKIVTTGGSCVIRAKRAWL